MSKPSSRLLLLTGLSAALVGLIVSALLLVDARLGGPAAGARDFGPTSGAGPVSSPRTPRVTTKEPSAAMARGDEAPRQARTSEPSSLVLPRLDVRAAVKAVGVAADGQIEIPANPKQVGWYRYSPEPGSPKGSTVIVGHVDSKGRGLGVLVALDDVRAGDRVLVRQKDGGEVQYRVSSRRTIGKRDLAASGAFRRDGPAVLTLITCAGPYLADKGGYQNNLVVTAVEAPT
ncbi:class F sortase [Streptomyces panaciradicis]|uniref:class F sortase n=1 Tax=Streptomyces panaciradicis TaxID=1470261 RepID=UPI00201D1DFF|nr:class F sortase [Streptomyces panaciradicis]MCL6673362.1 class F sortase [Streptomyces panaciradicis]